MQQVSANSGLQGSQVHGSVSSHSATSMGDPSHSSLGTSVCSKKRVRVEPSCDQSAKQFRFDSGQAPIGKKTIPLKSEVSSLVVEDGGISSSAHVDRFVRIMGCEWNNNSERQLDLVASRTMLAKVIGTTADRDCLVKFLDLGGLAILDKWLQEAQREKHFLNRNSTKDGEKAMHDLLLALLGAIERLPIDLVVHEAYSVGRSVNLLRNHVHPEVQRRAKNLADRCKRIVLSQMSQTMGGGLQAYAPLNSLYLQDGITYSQTLETCLPEKAACQSNVTGVLGKFVSVSPLSPSLDRQLRSQQTPFFTPRVEDNLQDFRGKIALPAHSMTSAGKSDFSHLSQLVQTSPNSQNGKTKASNDKAADINETSLVKSAVSRSAVVPRNRKISSASDNNDRSEGAALVSTSVNLPNISPVCGSKFYAGPSHSGVTLACDSSSVKKLYTICGAQNKLSMQSMTDVTDCMVRPSFPDDMSAGFSKGGYQLVANISGSEGSVIESRGSQSLSRKSVEMQEKMGISMDSTMLALSSMKRNSLVLSKPGSEIQDREYFDQLSSNVSSPSETSGHADLGPSGRNNSQILYGYTVHAPAITSDICGSTVDAELNRGREPGDLMLTSNGMQPVVDDARKGSIQPCPEVEAFGENQNYVRGNHGESGEPQLLASLSAVTTGKDVSSNNKTRRIENTDSHSMNVMNAMVNQRDMGDFHGSSIGCSSAGNSISGGCLDLKQKSPLLQKVHLASESITCSLSVIERPIFDLNEVVTSEDGILASQGSALALPLQHKAMPLLFASDTKPSPVTPTAPIAVLAAGKGYFTLPSAPHLPKGEIGWKGSAPTSAFHRAQPRQNSLEASTNVAEQSSHSKGVMDFDLNVAAAADSGCLDHTWPPSSRTATSMLVKQGHSAPNLEAVTHQQGQNARQAKGALDLNQVGDATEFKWRQDIDLNSGPSTLDNNDDVLTNKHCGIRPRLFGSTNYGAFSQGPSHPLKSVAPVLMPARAMNNVDSPYPVGANVPLANLGTPDGTIQYNIFLRNYPGMACPSLPSLPVVSYEGAANAFPPASMKNFSSPFLDTIGNQPLGSLFACPTSQSRSLPHMVGIVDDAVQHQSEGGFWSPSIIDLNAGPDVGDAKNVGENAQSMAAINEQMRIRHWAPEMASKQKEWDGCMNLPVGMQGVSRKQSVWR